MDALDELTARLQARLDDLASRPPTHGQLAELARLAGMIAGVRVAAHVLRSGTPSG